MTGLAAALGIGLVIAGFVLRVNGLLVVIVAALATAFAAGHGLLESLGLLGTGVLKGRFLLVILLTFPVIGLLERYGLREAAQAFIARQRRLTVGRFLMLYLALRQILAMLGLTSVAGHPHTVRPLVAPMSLALAERDHAGLDDAERDRLKALAAGTDNVGLFFGEDVFIAFGAVLLVQAFLHDAGIDLAPQAIALWAAPTAVAAFVIHAIRLWWLDRRLRRRGAADADAGARR